MWMFCVQYFFVSGICCALLELTESGFHIVNQLVLFVSHFPNDLHVSKFTFQRRMSYLKFTKGLLLQNVYL